MSSTGWRVPSYRLVAVKELFWAGLPLGTPCLSIVQAVDEALRPRLANSGAKNSAAKWPTGTQH